MPAARAGVPGGQALRSSRNRCPCRPRPRSPSSATRGASRRPGGGTAGARTQPGGRMTYLVRFTAPEFTSLCPVTGQPDFAHLVIDYVPGDWLVESQVAEALSGVASATMAPSTRTAPSPSASASRRCSSPTGCASAATGIRAAASPSTSSGRPARARGTMAARPGRARLPRARLTPRPALGVILNSDDIGRVAMASRRFRWRRSRRGSVPRLPASICRARSATSSSRSCTTR